MSTNETPIEISTDIFKIKVPIPFHAKYVNVYALNTGVLSLIDVGPKTDAAFNVLNHGLEKLGLSLREVERIICTHRHVDHMGLSKRVKEISNAETYIHESEKEKAQNLHAEIDNYIKTVEPTILEAGVPRQVLDMTANYYNILKRVSEPVEIDNTLKDGDTLDFGEVKLRVVHCPGHSEGSMCLYDEKRKLLFSGDHILKEITPNPFMSALYMEAPLKTYLDSLRKIERLDVETVLPGHGEMIYDHRVVIQNLFRHHEARKEVTLRILAQRPRTPYEVSIEMFGRLPTSETLLGLAEAAGHLEALLSEGRVESFKKNGLVYFRRTV